MTKNSELLGSPPLTKKAGTSTHVVVTGDGESCCLTTDVAASSVVEALRQHALAEGQNASVSMHITSTGEVPAITAFFSVLPTMTSSPRCPATDTDASSASSGAPSKTWSPTGAGAWKSKKTSRLSGPFFRKDRKNGRPT